LLGSVMALTVGPAWTVGFNAFSFLVMAAAVASLRRPYLPSTVSEGGFAERMVSGYRALRTTPGCFHGVVLLVLFNLTAVPFMGLIPIYVRSGFGGGTGLAGTVASAQGIGAIAGGITITMLASRFSRSLLIGRVTAAVSVGLLCYALAPNTVLLIPAAMLLGAASSSMFISTSAVIQRDAPSASRGRIMAIMQASMGISYGIGLLFIGTIGDLSSLHVAFSAGALLLLVGFWALTRRSVNWRGAFDGEPVRGEAALVAA
jgi:MFS family permease